MGWAAAAAASPAAWTASAPPSEAARAASASGTRTMRGVSAVIAIRTDPIRGLLFIKGSVPGHKGSWLTVSDAVKLPRSENAPYPAGILDTKKLDEIEIPEAGLVDEAAVHEIPALPSDAEVAAIAAEQEAGAAAEAAAAEAAEAEAADAAQTAENEKASAAEDSIKPAPDADEGKEG